MKWNTEFKISESCAQLLLIQGNADFTCPHCDIGSISRGESGAECRKPESLERDVDQRWRQPGWRENWRENGKSDIWSEAELLRCSKVTMLRAFLRRSQSSLVTTHVRTLVSLLCDADMSSSQRGHFP